MTAKKAAAAKPEKAADRTDASPESPAPPLVSTLDQLKEAAGDAAPTPKKKG